MQLGGHVFARLEAHAVFAHLAREQIVHLLVRAGKHVAGVRHQGLLERKVRQRVVHHFVDHRAHGLAVVVVAGVVELVDVVDDALVLPVDFADARFKIGRPVQMCHGKCPKMGDRCRPKVTNCVREPVIPWGNQHSS
ncbi:hypothetical protein FQZ97_942750 [compost metagenome]